MNATDEEIAQVALHYPQDPSAGSPYNSERPAAAWIPSFTDHRCSGTSLQSDTAVQAHGFVPWRCERPSLTLATPADRFM